jgi:hypothetical protein
MSAVVIHWSALCRAVAKCAAYVPAHCLPIAGTCKRSALTRRIDPVDRPCRVGESQAEKAANVDAWQRLGSLEGWRAMGAKAEGLHLGPFYPQQCPERSHARGTLREESALTHMRQRG